MFNPKFLEILKTEVEKAGQKIEWGTKILSFKDKAYSPENGGFHPVEVMTENGKIQYVTDFCYFGPDNELVKDLDFAFNCGVFQQLGIGESREYPIEEGRDLFNAWQENFILYYAMGMYDNIEVETI